MFNNLEYSSERIDAPTILGLFWGQVKRVSVKAIQPLSSQELTHKMLCRQSQLSAQPYRTVTENIGIIFLFCAHISNFLLFRNKCNFRHRGIGLYIRPIWAYIRYINTPNPITFYSKILRSIGLPVVVNTCFASLSAGLYVKKPACLSP